VISIWFIHKGFVVVKKFCFLLCMCFCFFSHAGLSQDKFCLLTDMSSDVDDLGALHVALYFHKKGVIDLQCVIVGTSNTSSHIVVKHYIEEYWKIQGVRVGRNLSNNGFFGADQFWVNKYIARNGLSAVAVENGAVLLASLLDANPAMKVVEVGPATTVFNARRRPANYSQMGARAPSGVEYNIQQFVPGALYINSAPIDYYDFVLGINVCTGSLSDFKDSSSPLNLSYRDYRAAFNGGLSFTNGCHPSWDLVTVLGAIDDSYFTYSRGTFFINGAGYSQWSSHPSGRHRLANGNYAQLRKVINEILNIGPEDMRPKVNMAPILMLLLGDD